MMLFKLLTPSNLSLAAIPIKQGFASTIDEFIFFLLYHTKGTAL
jgi:hypothetical protein